MRFLKTSLRALGLAATAAGGVVRVWRYDGTPVHALEGHVGVTEVVTAAEARECEAARRPPTARP